MPAPGVVTLGSLVLQAQFRANMENSRFVTTPEWVSYANNSVKELIDILIGAYGNDYPTGNPPLTIPTDGVSIFYPLPTGQNYQQPDLSFPPAFYKLLGLDLQLAATQDSFVTIRPFEFADRNRYAIPNFQSFYGITNLRYRIFSDKLYVTPLPAAGQFFRLWYLPRPQDLMITPYGTANASVTTITIPDTAGLKTGMLISSPAGQIPDGTTITGITANTSITISQATTASLAGQILIAWSNATQVDSLAGWEEYAIVDMAIKALEKEESDVSVLMAQKEALRIRIMAMANNRDAGAPAKVADAQYSDFWWPSGNLSGSGTGSG